MTPDDLSGLRTRTIDYDGTEQPDGAEPISFITCGELRALLDRIESLQEENERLRAEVERLASVMIGPEGGALLSPGGDPRAAMIRATKPQSQWTDEEAEIVAAEQSRAFKVMEK